MGIAGRAPAPMVAAAVERILNESGRGAVVGLERWQELRGGDRSTVWRVGVRGDAARGSTSVVVKTALGADGDDARAGGPRWRLANEWASLDLIGQLHLESPVAPRLLGGDLGAGVLVLEDLGTGVGLDRVLLGHDPVEAEKGLLGYARAGRMHAAARPHAERHARLRAELAPLARPDLSTAAEAALDGPGLVVEFRRAAGILGVEVDGATATDLEAVSAFWESPPVRTLVHADPCPDNCLVLGDGVRLVDFEFGAFRHPLIDGACMRLCFPSCWCAGTIPEGLLRRAEAVYRAALAADGGWADDDRAFDRALVEACAYWTVGMFAWAVPDLVDADVEWGLASGRQRVLHRLTLFAHVARERGHLGALGKATEAVRARLAERWPDTDPLALLPTFRDQPR